MAPIRKRVSASTSRPSARKPLVSKPARCSSRIGQHSRLNSREISEVQSPVVDVISNPSLRCTDPTPLSIVDGSAEDLQLRNDGTSNDTIVSCSTCSFLQSQVSSLQKENERLTELFNVTKSDLSREKTIVNQLSCSNTKAFDTCNSLQHRNSALSARIKVLEESLPSRHRNRNSRPRTGSKTSFSQMRKAELKTYIKGIEEKHQALCIQVRNAAEGIAFNEMTESSEFSEFSDDNVLPPIRRHDWTGRCETLNDLPHDYIQGTSPISKPDGSTCKDVPKSPLEQLSNGFFTPSGQYPECMIQSALWQVATEDKDFSRFRENPNWDEALTALQNDQATRSYFLRVLNSAQSNHNRESKTNFFTSLGYDIFNPRCSSTPESREIERCHLQRIFGVSNEQEADLDSINTTIWRTKSWQQLYNPEKDLPVEPVLDDVENDGSDIFFENNAAKNAFISFLSYIPGENESVLSLARADAWITANVFLLSLGDGKGGKRNSQFKDAFNTLFPRSLRSILLILHDFVLQNGEEELIKPSLQDYKPCTKFPTENHFLLKSTERSLTDIVFMPSDEHYYVYINRNTFCKHICHWFFLQMLSSQRQVLVSILINRYTIQNTLALLRTSKDHKGRCP